MGKISATHKNIEFQNYLVLEGKKSRKEQCFITSLALGIFSNLQKLFLWIFCCKASKKLSNSVSSSKPILKKVTSKTGSSQVAPKNSKTQDVSKKNLNLPPIHNFSVNTSPSIFKPNVGNSDSISHKNPISSPVANVLPPVAMPNAGNTCYYSSAIQGLLNISYYREIARQIPEYQPLVNEYETYQKKGKDIPTWNQNSAYRQFKEVYLHSLKPNYGFNLSKEGTPAQVWEVILGDFANKGFSCKARMQYTDQAMLAGDHLSKDIDTDFIRLDGTLNSFENDEIDHDDTIWLPRSEGGWEWFGSSYTREQYEEYKKSLQQPSGQTVSALVKVQVQGVPCEGIMYALYNDIKRPHLPPGTIVKHFVEAPQNILLSCSQGIANFQDDNLFHLTLEADQILTGKRATYECDYFTFGSPGHWTCYVKSGKDWYRLNDGAKPQIIAHARVIEAAKKADFFHYGRVS